MEGLIAYPYTHIALFCPVKLFTLFVNFNVHFLRNHNNCNYNGDDDDGDNDGGDYSEFTYWCPSVLGVSNRIIV